MSRKDPNGPVAKAWRREYIRKNRAKARQWGREWYYRNRSRELEKDHKAIRERIDLLQSIKEITPCTDCGKNYPHYVMEFDHKEPPRKYKGGRRVNMAAICGFNVLVEELSKCDIVCANCHCARTWTRKQMWPKQERK